MITTTIKNICRDGERIVVFISFSNGIEKSFVFLPSVTEKEIRQTIKGAILEMDLLEEKVQSFQDLIGKEIK
jgi:hypothetical protein